MRVKLKGEPAVKQNCGKGAFAIGHTCITTARVLRVGYIMLMPLDIIMKVHEEIDQVTEEYVHVASLGTPSVSLMFSEFREHIARFL